MNEGTPSLPGQPGHYRKSPRLKGFDYRGGVAAHLTFVTRERRLLFEDERLGQICVDAILESARRFDGVVHAYCVMPDHAHVLVEMSPGVSLELFAKHFKQLSGFRIKAQLGHPAWQQSYFDRLLRKEESLIDVASYIWANPVEAGLADHPADYSLSGPLEVLGTLEQA